MTCILAWVSFLVFESFPLILYVFKACLKKWKLKFTHSSWRKNLSRFLPWISCQNSEKFRYSKKLQIMQGIFWSLQDTLPKVSHVAQKTKYLEKNFFSFKKIFFFSKRMTVWFQRFWGTGLDWQTTVLKLSFSRVI